MSTQVELYKDETAVAAPVAQVDDLSHVQRLGKMLVASGYFTDARDVAQAAVKVLAGRELGIPAIASMMGIHIIKGKVALGAHLIASRIKAHGYDFRVRRLDEKGCSIEFLGKSEGGKREALGVSEFTEQDAKNAQIGSEMYKKFPRNMYYSRAISNGAKWYTPDVFGGAPVYTAEELGADRVDENGDYAPEAAKPETHEELVQRRIAEEQAKVQPQLSKPVAAAILQHVEEQEPNAAAHPTGEDFRAASKYDRLRMFQDLKARFTAVLGDKGEPRYYDWLNHNGVEKSDQFKSLGPALKSFEEMSHDVALLEAGTAAFNTEEQSVA